MTIKPRAVHLSLIILLVFAASIGVGVADGLSSVRYQKSGKGHMYLSTHTAVVVGEREVSLSVYLLQTRYVAVYSEARRKSATESQVVLEGELSGAVSGASLAGLGTLRVLAETKNGKPVVELVLAQPLHSCPSGLALRLAWTYGSYAPESVQ